MFLVTLLLCAIRIDAAAEAQHPDWTRSLLREVQLIDKQTPGNLGLYIKRLSDDTELKYQSDRKWYLASTIKVPVAIVVLQHAEAGKLSLEQELVLKKTDYVDGTGDTNWSDPGVRISIRTLLERMITQSDSTATDMLLRRLGVDVFNSELKSRIAPEGFNQITSLLQVRYDAYSEVHPKARALSNIDFINLKKEATPEERFTRLIAKLGVSRAELNSQTLAEAFEKYYEKGANSGSLDSFASMLERLAEGKLLSPTNTSYLLELMEKMVTGEKRLKAGLPKGLKFAQKTGTQLRRICNMGIIRKRDDVHQTVVVSTCLEKFDDPDLAEQTLQKVGAAISRSKAI